MRERRTRSRVPLMAGAAALSLLVAACGGGEGSASEGDVDSVTLVFSSGVGENHPGQRHMRTWAERVTELTDGAVQFEYNYGGSLLPIDEEIPGVGDGRADMAYGSPHYNPTLLPLTTVGELPFITRNAEAQMKAAHDLLQEHEALQAEWQAAGVKPLFQALIGSSLLGSTEELTSIEDLQGLQIRAFGAGAKSYEAAGANVVTIPFPELYESAQRGLVDAISGLGFTGFHSGQLYQVTPIIHDPGHGESIAFQTIVINQEVYDSLSPEIKEAFDQATEEYYERVADLVTEDEEAACRAMLEDGAEFIVWDDEAVAAWGPLIGDQLQEEWVKSMEDQGLPGRDVLGTYLDLVEKYEAEASYVPAVERCAQIAAEQG